MAPLSIGLIGLDTSHCRAFTELFNAPDHPHHVPGGTVVAGFPGGSAAFSKSHARVDKFTFDLATRFGVEVFESIEEVVTRVDAVMLESCDGRQHLAQFEEVAPHGKPVFIDKPLACSSADARAILRLAGEHGTPVFSASSLRYAAGIRDLPGPAEVASAVAFGPVDLLPDYPGYFWYGVHVADILYALMGPGCQQVHVTPSEVVDCVAATWEDDRVATLLGYRFVGGHKWGATAFTHAGTRQALAGDAPPAYALLLREVVKFFQTGIAPVAPAEMVEVMAFLEAINAARATGQPVPLAREA